MEGEGEGGVWGKWKKRITRVFVGGKSGKESRGSVEELPRIVVSWKLQTLEFFFWTLCDRSAAQRRWQWRGGRMS